MKEKMKRLAIDMEKTIDKIMAPVSRFIHLEIVLLLAVITAIIWANFSYESYRCFCRAALVCCNNKKVPEDGYAPAISDAKQHETG